MLEVEWKPKQAGWFFHLIRAEWEFSLVWIFTVQWHLYVQGSGFSKTTESLCGKVIPGWDTSHTLYTFPLHSLVHVHVLVLCWIKSELKKKGSVWVVDSTVRPQFFFFFSCFNNPPHWKLNDSLAFHGKMCSRFITVSSKVQPSRPYRVGFFRNSCLRKI